MASTGFVRPTLAELIDRISGDMNTRTGRDSRVRRSVLWVLVRVFAGAVHLLYGFAAWVARQILPDTADEAVLRRHAAIWRVDQVAAAKATGKAAFMGVVATTIPAGTVLQREDGAEFTVTADATVGGGGTVDASVQAVVAGDAGNCDAGVVLALTSPIAGITSDGTVKVAPDNVTGGLDAEPIDSWRERLLDHIAERPQGGAVADYDEWVREVFPNARVFVAPLELGPGTVAVRFIVPIPDGGTSADAIPDAGQVADAQAHLDVLRPVTADLTVFAPVAKPIALSIHVAPDTAAIRTAVAAELDDLFWRESGNGATVPNSHLREAISRATGESSHTLGAVAGGAGTADVTQASNEFAHLGVVTWY